MSNGKSAYMPYRGNANRLKGASPLTRQYLERQSLIANLVDIPLAISPSCSPP
jgi:hypothetical protein